MTTAERVRAIAEAHVGRTGGVLQALREVVQALGHVAREHEHVVADVFNLSKAEVRGIVSFYHDLRTAPPPPNEVRICQAEACQAVGCRDLTRQVEAHLGVRLGEANDEVALEAVYCLGLCAQGPSMLVNGRLVAHATVDDLLPLDASVQRAP